MSDRLSTGVCIQVRVRLRKGEVGWRLVKKIGRRQRRKTESRSRGNTRVIFTRINGTVRGNFHVETFGWWGMNG